MKPIPIPTLHLFPPLDESLLTLLSSLSAEEWNARTRAKQWNVKDIAAHLLDGNIRQLSLARDGYLGMAAPVINSYSDLVQYLNDLNRHWVDALKRASPGVLIMLLQTTGRDYYHYLSHLDPFREAIFSVAWAGEEKSLNWFHIAREFTEKWHHQQQIREAVNKPGIMTPEFIRPVLQTFMMALPHTYRSIKPATSGNRIQITVTGELNEHWILHYNGSEWVLSQEESTPHHIETRITLTAETAWQLFTNGLSKSEAEDKVAMEGNITLGKPMLSMLSVMA